MEYAAVGTAVAAKSFGPQVSKVFRLNQVDAGPASEYLGNLGFQLPPLQLQWLTCR